VFCSGESLTASQLQVRLGGILATDPEPDVLYAGVSRVIPYPDFEINRLLGDIALLQLSTAVSFTDTIRPVCLPPRDVNLNRFKVCVDTGFGRTGFSRQYSNILTSFLHLPTIFVLHERIS